MPPLSPPPPPISEPHLRHSSTPLTSIWPPEAVRWRERGRESAERERSRRERTFIFRCRERAYAYFQKISRALSLRFRRERESEREFPFHALSWGHRRGRRSTREREEFYGSGMGAMWWRDYIFFIYQRDYFRCLYLRKHLVPREPLSWESIYDDEMTRHIICFPFIESFSTFLHDYFSFRENICERDRRESHALHLRELLTFLSRGIALSLRHLETFSHLERYWYFRLPGRTERCFHWCRHLHIIIFFIRLPTRDFLATCRHYADERNIAERVYHYARRDAEREPSRRFRRETEREIFRYIIWERVYRERKQERVSLLLLFTFIFHLERRHAEREMPMRDLRAYHFTWERLFLSTRESLFRCVTLYERERDL